MTIKTKIIEVVPYNPDWPRMFEKEAALLKQVLGKYFLVANNYHFVLYKGRKIVSVAQVELLNNTLHTLSLC